MLEEPPAVFQNKEYIYIYIYVYGGSFRESCYSSSVVLFNLSARLQSRVPGRRHCILAAQTCDAPDSISELSFRTESDRKGCWLSRATLPGCGQQHEERRFKFLERVWCVMTKLYRREPLCGPLTNRFAETNSTGAACGQIRSRVSRWPKLSERHSESQLSGHRSLAHAVPALSLPMESVRFVSSWHAEQGLAFVLDFPRLLHRAVMVRGGQNWSLDLGYSLAFDSVAEELEQEIQVFQGGVGQIR